jgi:pSer/pThr/pTyr-binding forkhead associated (FHA) protein
LNLFIAGIRRRVAATGTTERIKRRFIMKPCPVCQAENADDAEYCQDCGNEMTADATASASSDTGSLSDTAEEETPGALSEPHLVVVSSGTKIPLRKKESIIGREDPISNIFPDIDTTPFGGLEGGVSRRHARIYQQGGVYYIEDMNSTNYTLVNKQKVDPANGQKLAAGDEIRLGRVAFMFML